MNMIQRSMHVRALSFNSVPKAVFRVFRVPTYAFTAAGGAFAYANYKVDGEWEERSSSEMTRTE